MGCRKLENMCTERVQLWDIENWRICVPERVPLWDVENWRICVPERVLLWDVENWRICVLTGCHCGMYKIGEYVY